MMKKITLLLTLLTVSFGFSQEFPFNFNTDLQGWVPNGGPAPTVNYVADDGSGTSGLMEVVGAANTWDSAKVVFPAPIDLSDDANNTVRFRMRSTTAPDDEVHTHGGAFQNGDASNGGSEINFTTTGTEWTDVELNFTLTGLTSFENFKIFVDTGIFGVGGDNTATGTYYIDDITIGADPVPTCDDGIQNGDEEGVDCGGTGGCDACIPTCDDGIQNGDEEGVDCGGTGGCPDCPVPPSTSATPPPARDANDVVSIFSGAYTDVVPSGGNIFAGASYDNFTVDSADDTRRLTLVNPGGGYQYEYFGASGALDLTDFTHVHIDFYVEGSVSPGQLFQVFLLNFPAYPDGAGATNLNTSFDVSVLGSGSWISGDVELSTFGGNLTRDKIALVQVVGAGAPAFGPIYIQNIYFHKNTTLGVDDKNLVDFKVFPNPTQDSWNIRTQQTSIQSIKVFDVLGKNVLSLAPNNSEATIDGASLKTGLYFAQIKTEAGINSIKLVKQ